MAPEIGSHRRYDIKTDIWLIFFWMIERSI
jgi:hypothetical protein